MSVLYPGHTLSHTQCTSMLPGRAQSASLVKGLSGSMARKEGTGRHNSPIKGFRSLGSQNTVNSMTIEKGGGSLPTTLLLGKKIFMIVLSTH